MKKEPGNIKTGSKVAIIGGGPAGSFFALYLLHYARERGIRPEVTIYQERNFDELGPAGCKGCAGILSMSFLRNLDELGLRLPDEIIQARVENYAVHSPYSSISISNPEQGMEIVSIYRGGGPRISHYEKHISFDGWLLKQAQAQGVRVETQRVSGVSLEHGAVVEVAGSSLEYDLVVLATGVNTKPITIAGLDYVPPKKRTMALVELYAGTDEVQSRLGSVAHAFLIPKSGLIFGTLVPKGPFINVSLLSTSESPVSVDDFLKHEIVQKILPGQYQRACSCQPRAIVSSACNYYTSGFVAVGAAAVSRLYKDGIGSSLLTAREAARTVVHHGISRQDFGRYYHPFYRAISRDNLWGRVLFSVNDRTKDSRAFFLAQHRLIGDEQSNMRGPQPFTRAAWGMFSGNYSYTSIARMIFNPASLFKLYWDVFWEILSRLFGKEADGPRKLHVGGRKVLILGSGFGGTYTLRNLVPALNRNENVETTMVSDENFFLFAPLLHEVAMGGIETRHIAYPIRKLHWRDRFNFIQARVEKIDLKARQVITTGGILGFDYLVVALGGITLMPESGPTETKENIFALKTIRDSMLIRNHIIGVFEQASTERDPERLKQLLTFVISGAGYTGVQIATELSDFARKTLIKLYRTIDRGSIRIILVEAESKIVAELHTKLGAYAMKQLKFMGIEVRLRSRVTGVWKDHVEINAKERVPANTVIWVAGAVANPVVAELNVPRDKIGRVLVNEYMEVPGFPGVYVVGDCAHFKDRKSREPIPPRAHTGVRQAKIAANNILADIRGRDKKPYRYSNPVEMVSLGASKAMFRYRGLRLYGFAARLIWFGAYSLLITGTYNRIRIIIDWLLSTLFGRDTTFLRLMK